MFTLKLYTESRTRIVEAESFTCYRYGNGATQVTAHQRNQEQDACWWVGEPDEPLDIDSTKLFDKAIIENAAGRTTEIIHVPLALAAVANRGASANPVA